MESGSGQNGCGMTLANFPCLSSSCGLIGEIGFVLFWYVILGMLSKRWYGAGCGVSCGIRSGPEMCLMRVISEYA